MQHEMSDRAKFYLGKNKVMIKALGRTPEEEIDDNTSRLSKFLTGQVCLVFSKLNAKDLKSALKKYEIEDYAQAGSKAIYDVFLEKGTDALDSFGHSMEPLFRQLGLPTRLNFQKIELLQDVNVCKMDTTLSVEQSKLLKLLGHKMSKFKLQVLVHRGGSGKVKEFDEGLQYLTEHKHDGDVG